MLWEEVRAAPENRNNTTIQNTLRRILESYFKLLGGEELDDICEKFNGDDKIRCQVLCSWINDGSHGNDILSDVYYVEPDEATIQMYLKVFEAIFKETKQDAHYKMMMG
jgi:wobble nucleotide-excising tRNase